MNLVHRNTINVKALVFNRVNSNKPTSEVKSIDVIRVHPIFQIIIRIPRILAENKLSKSAFSKKQLHQTQIKEKKYLKISRRIHEYFWKISMPAYKFLGKLLNSYVSVTYERDLIKIQIDVL